LSGGELQRVAITLVLGVPADVLLIDEPSAYLDSEQRIIASKVIKKFVMGSKRTAFVVEHDFVSSPSLSDTTAAQLICQIMATYLADRVIVFDGKPAIESFART
jgi:ATP-binding cassette subfamily E protein 1